MNKGETKDLRILYLRNFFLRSNTFIYKNESLVSLVLKNLNFMGILIFVTKRIYISYDDRLGLQKGLNCVCNFSTSNYEPLLWSS